MTPTRVLTIAGSDPSAGAGLVADLEVFRTFGCRGMAVVAALTAQDSTGVRGVRAVDAEFVAAQIEALLSDCPPAAAKTGMLLTQGAVAAVADAWQRRGAPALVVDPVLASSGGVTLCEPAAATALAVQLFPVAALVTPNAREAESFSGVAVRDVAGAVAAAEILLERGATAVLVKGGHVPGRTVTDVLIQRGGSPVLFERPRIVDGRRRRGTGCALSAAIAAGLARGLPLAEAVDVAGRFVHEAIARAQPSGAGALTLDLGVRVTGMPS